MALIWNSYDVLKGHRIAKHLGIRENAWNALEMRVIEVGAKDLDGSASDEDDEDEEVGP